MFNLSFRGAVLPLLAVGAGLGFTLVGCGGGGGTNLPTPGSTAGGLGTAGGSTGGGGGAQLSSNAIVFVSTRDGNPEIYSMNADGTNPRRLTTNAATDEQPSRSRDGRRIVFSSQRDGNPEIYIMNADGTGQQRLTNDLSVDGAPQDSRPVFSPDGTKIVWDSTRGGLRRLFTMNADGGNQRPISVATSGQNSLDGSWNRDNSRLLGFIVNTQNANGGFNDLSSITPATTDTGVAQVQILQAGTSAAHPRYSPDGARIVLWTTAGTTVGDARLQLLNSNGTLISNGPNGGTNQTSPSFSPDGNRLAWAAQPVTNSLQRQIYVATLGTNAAQASGTAITTSAQGDNYDASWTP